MPFNEVFGGNAIYPASPTFLELTLVENTQLEWPLEQNMAGGTILATEIEIFPAGPGLSVMMPDATQGSPGYTTTFFNAAADTFTVKSSTGVTLATVASGDAWTIWLRDNTTPSGLWRVFQMGVGISNANAADLAGAGLVAISTTLNEEIEVSSQVVDYGIVNLDRARLIQWLGGVGNLTLPDAATVGANWFVSIKNSGSGIVTVLPQGGATIDGQASLPLSLEDSSWLVTNGVNWFTLGFGQSNPSVFDFLAMSVAGSGSSALTGSQLNRVSYEFTGVLTGNRSIIVPNTVQQYWVFNNTTGPFTLTIKTAANPGVTVPQGTRIILYCNGTDVVNAETNTASLPAVVQGDTLYGSAPGILTALPKTPSLYQVLKNSGASNNPAWGAPPFLAAKVTRIGTQAAASGSPTIISWNAEVTDEGAWHDNVTNPTRLTVPPGVNWYKAEALVIINLTSANVPFTVQLFALINGSGGNSPVAQAYFPSLPGASLSIPMYVSTGWEACVPGQYIEFEVIVTGTGGGTIQGTSIGMIEGRP